MKLEPEIFEDVPESIDETWTHGALLGGMAHDGYSQLAIADSYIHAGDTLIESVLRGGEGYELAYPILFTYRHAIELYLKICLRTSPRTHDLNRLLADFCGHVQTTFHQQVPSWFNRLISEVGTFDPASMLFRYADAGAASRQLQARGEFWVDLRVLREKMERVQRGFHSVINRQS